jgi:transcriptional regulator with XRE-family HTH domain
MEEQVNQGNIAQRRYPPYRSGIPSEEERPYLEALGQVLRQARLARDWSYRMQAKIIGKDAGTWCRLEHGQQRPRPETLQLAARGLCLNYQRLVGLAGPALAPPRLPRRHRLRISPQAPRALSCSSASAFSPSRMIVRRLT